VNKINRSVVFKIESDKKVLMLKDPMQKKVMPDVATNESPELQGVLEWVGMEKVALPVVLSHGAQVLCEADIFVNLAKKMPKAFICPGSIWLFKKVLNTNA
jgi:predicted acyl esterase